MTVAGLVLACAGPGTDGEEEVSGDREEMAQSCVDYLDCLASADPETYATLKDSYGPRSSCWADAQSAEGCDVACTSGLADAADAYPDDSLCTGRPEGSVVTGAWSFTATDSNSNCAARYGHTLEMTIERFDGTLVDNGDGTITFEDASFTAAMDNLEPQELGSLACNSDGDTFRCEAWASRRNWYVDGRYIQDYWTLSGSWGDGGSTADATMKGELRSLSGEPNDECSATTLLDGAAE